VQVRRPPFDFTGINPLWGGDIAAVHMINALGIVPAFVEPFLIKVMQRAKEKLDPISDAGLIRDIEVFNKQEAQHFKFHVALNRWIREHGYERMEQYERKYAAEYEQMLSSRSLLWLLSYCEGFESMGLASASAFVDGGIEEMLPDADPRPIALWRWHLAEEYEHRTVAFRTLKAVCGENPWTFYWVRIRGLLYASHHIGSTVRGLHRYLVEVDGSAGPKRPRLRSSARMLGRRSSGLFGVLSPHYDPALVPPPKRLSEILSWAER